MSIMPLEQAVPVCEVKLVLDFAKEQLLRHWAEQHNAQVLQVNYVQQVVMQLSVPEAAIDELSAFCAAQAIKRQQ